MILCIPHLTSPLALYYQICSNCKVQLFKIRVVRPQKQNGGSDCGVFAIAFATSIAINHNVDMKFDQARIRAHLVSYIEKRESLLFPSKLYAY